MVQFGKTETTTNNTTNINETADRRTINTSTSNDNSDKRQYYTEDKTHKEYFNSKDIFNIVNNYQNVNMSLLAASMAISVVTPLINGLISKAINKWNDEVPIDLQLIANQEYSLIHGKCENLISSANSGIILYPDPKKDIESKDFLQLQHVVNNHLRELMRKASDDIIEGIIKKDRLQIQRGESLLLTVKNPFMTSYESHVKYTTTPEQIGIFQYDQSIAALNRILPSAMVGDSTTILVRKLTPLHCLNITEQKYQRMKHLFRDVYDFQELPKTGDLYNFYLTPLIGYADLETVSSLYGIDLTQISNAHFFSSCQHNEDIIVRDGNLSGSAILETKLGHSMSIIGETVNEVADVMLNVLRRLNQNEDIQHSYRRVERGPWTSGKSTRQFGNLMSIFNIRDESDIIKLDEDFRSMSSLIQIVGTMKKLYPELIPRSDPQMKAFLRKCRQENDKVIIPTAPSYLSILNMRSDNTAASSIYGIDSEFKGKSRMFDASQSVEHLVITDVSGMTALDQIFMDSNVSGDLPSGIMSISELSPEHMIIIQHEFMLTIFTITKARDSENHERCKITIADSDIVRKDMKGKQMMNSRMYKDQVWHVRGSKLFDKQSKFFKTLFI